MKKISIRVRKTDVFSDMERLLLTVKEKKPQQLYIPNQLASSGGFGMEAAALQVYGSWIRTVEERVLALSVATGKEFSEFEELCNSLFGLCALRLSDAVIAKNGSLIDMRIALEPARKNFEMMRAEKFNAAFKGLYIAIPAIKAHVPVGYRSREFDSPFYNGEEVVGSKKFQEITRRALEAIRPTARNSSWVSGPEVMNLAEIIRELFTNTHKHARSDGNGNAYAINFRAVSFRSVRLSRNRLQDISKSGGGSLAKFIAGWLPSDNLYFSGLEVSVIDAGPGLARRWVSGGDETLSFDEQKKAVVECFKKHMTTDLAHSSGSGLSNVLRDLKLLKGWLRVRSGNALIEKSFFNQEGSPNIGEKDVRQMDAFADGLLVTVIIPLKSLAGR